MSTLLTKKMTAVRSRVDSSMFTPLLLILSLVAVVSSLQTYAAARAGSGTLPALIPILISKSAYYWYFALLASVIEAISRRIILTRWTALQWSTVHAGTLVCSFLLHEALSLAVDALVLGTHDSAGLMTLLFNDSAVWIETFAYVIFLLVFSLIEYQRINHENETKCSLLEARLTKTKLQELRNNIQPTFLFNTLQSIHALVREHRNHDANHVLSLLSDFLRTTVYDNDRDEIPLEEEMRFLGQFIEIEKVRSRRPLFIHQDIARDVSSAVVPNFILQPIVEALVRGMSRQEHARSELVIRARKSESMLEVEIEEHSPDTPQAAGDRAHDDDMDERVLAISRERLVQLYGGAHEMTIRRSAGSVLVRIGIPYREVVIESEGTFIGEAAL
jgi:two-component system, LytTR family, sensor kinase